ncbi:MAG TPA: benzoate-CoA ligase family protein [Conexibacter sp.]|jgi:benzoate-CoA ligase family protein|nr:benzoate-CoA ligase family protein [Conexibacter sp.]
MLDHETLPVAFNVATHFVDRHLADGRGERVALRTADGATTYAALAECTNRIGNVLLECGVQCGDRVLMALADGVDFVASWYAVLKVGAVTAEVYTFLQAKDYVYYLGYTRAPVVIADAVTLDRVREAVDAVEHPVRVLVAGDAPAELRAGEQALSELAAAASTRLDAAPTTRDDVAIWKFTTGSTGAPKAAVHPMHSPALSSAWYGQGVLGIGPDDVVVPVPKLFFGYARDLTALFPFEVGGCGVVFPERTTPERIFDLVERHRATILVQVPTMMRAMLEHPGAAERDLSSLRFCTSAGEALPHELQRRWLDAFGVEVLDGMGSSEAYHVYISNRPGEARPGSIGRLVPGYAARVLDTDGAPVADGEAGELHMTGHTAALEYFGAPDKSAVTFDGNTVRTGDLVVRDADGFFWFRGRTDDLLKVGGIWVAPAEIEQCLLEHDTVRDCAVVGFDDGGLTKTRAFVVLREGHPPTAATADALKDHVRAHLSPHKYPRDVRFLDALPRSPSGKVDRRGLSVLEPVG